MGKFKRFLEDKKLIEQVNRQIPYDGIEERVKRFWEHVDQNQDLKNQKADRKRRLEFNNYVSDVLDVMSIPHERTDQKLKDQVAKDEQGD